MKRIQILTAAIAATLASLSYADKPDKTPKPPKTPEVSVSASDPIAFRGLSSGAFVLRRESTDGDLTIKISFSGSASNGVDYVQLPESVTIPAGSHSIGLAVEPLGDGVSHPNEWANLTILKDDAYHIKHSPKASVLIKGNEFENEAPTVAITNPTNDTSLAAHSDLTIDVSATDANDTVEKVSFYANDKFLGSDSDAPYSLTWSNVPPGNFALFARAEDQFGKSVVSSPVHITATNPPSAHLSVSIASPANKSTFAANSDIPITVELSDEAAVQSVAFFSGDDLIGTASAAPFSIIWSTVPPGSYSLRAKAADTNGAVSLSGKVKITVTNDLPVVSITTPANNAIIAGPTDIEIAADATDANGIKEVTFYGDAHILGTLTAAPYSLTWSNVPPGRHVIISKAVDSFGAFRSSAVIITVSNTAPTVVLTGPADGAALVAPATIELAADASDADGIKYVTFWAGKRLLATDKTAPYTLTLDHVMNGTYTFTARAVDIYGEETTSEPIKVNVERLPKSHGHK